MQNSKLNKNNYDHKAIENKWQEKWESVKTYSPDIENAKSPFYNLMMFPYPSAEGLHVGNMYAFTGADVYGRFKRMQGNDVLEPIGLDGFGIHSENYALKIGRHPLEQSKLAEKNFYRQLKSIGNGFDLTRTLETYDPEYYKWTQWLFITLFKSGLAYRKKAEVNWCPNCKTVLADEQVLQKTKDQRPKTKDGAEKSEVTIKVCERCDTEVELKFLEQWFFRITDYAQRLLDNIEKLDWTEKVKIAQRNWIGRSEGAEIEFKIQNSKFKIDVFTTRPDTLYGATFMVISPEHELASQIESGELRIENSEEVRAYIRLAKKKTDMERTAEGKEKTGVFSGLYAINPVNNEKIPVWIADYVLSSYGTGAIMAVPGHDSRDYEFAVKYGLPVEVVIAPQGDNSKFKIQNSKLQFKIKNEWIEGAYERDGTLVNSGSWDGLEVPKDIGRIIDDLEVRGLGKRKVNYHLRDWLISRQRYWGPPIPMIYCQNCANEGRSWFTENRHSGLDPESHEILKQVQDDRWSAGWYPVADDQLPVLLPDVKDWKPLGTGKAPLANHPEFYEVKCPSCGEGATRETDVSDTFLDSSWYFLRYPSVKNQKSKIKNQNLNSNDKKSLEFRNSDLELLWNPEITRRWLPVDMYIGGAEHSVLHLLYSRFVTMVLKDLGYLEFEEPFSKFYAHGLIIKDGAKMSKSKGNVVVPDEYIAKYGADSLRTYLMFIGPYSDGGDFRDSGIEGINRFLKRVWRLMDSVVSNKQQVASENSEQAISYQLQATELDVVMHKTIKGVTEDLENLRYNTAIAKLMEYYNEISKTKNQIPKIHVETYLKLLAPFAPHLTEELWQKMKHEARSTKQAKNEKTHDSSFMLHDSIHIEKWPEFDTAMLVSDTVTIVVQVNGKRRGEISLSVQEAADSVQVEKAAKEAVNKYFQGQNIKKTIYVPEKIVNFVI